MGLRRTLPYFSTPFRIFLDPFQYCFLGEQEPLADLDAGKVIKPYQVLDYVMVILSPADFRDAEKGNELVLSHQLRS